MLLPPPELLSIGAENVNTSDKHSPQVNYCKPRCKGAHNVNKHTKPKLQKMDCCFNITLSLPAVFPL